MGIGLWLSISYLSDFQFDSSQTKHRFFLQPATRILNVRLVHVLNDLPKVFLLLDPLTNQLFCPDPVRALLI